MSDIQFGTESGTALIEAQPDTKREDVAAFKYLPLPRVSDPSLALYAVRLLGDPERGYWPAFLLPEVETKVVANLAHPYAMTIEEMRRAPQTKSDVNRLEAGTIRYLTHPNGQPITVKTRAFRCADPYYKDKVYFELPEAARATTIRRPIVDIKLWCPVWRAQSEGGPGQHAVYDGIVVANPTEAKLAKRMNLKAGTSRMNARQGECPICANSSEKHLRQADARRRIAILLEKLSMPVPQALAEKMATDGRKS